VFGVEPDSMELLTRLVHTSLVKIFDSIRHEDYGANWPKDATNALIGVVALPTGRFSHPLKRAEENAKHSKDAMA